MSAKRPRSTSPEQEQADENAIRLEDVDRRAIQPQVGLQGVLDTSRVLANFGGSQITTPNVPAAAQPFEGRGASPDSKSTCIDTVDLGVVPRHFDGDAELRCRDRRRPAIPCALRAKPPV